MLKMTFGLQLDSGYYVLAGGGTVSVWKVLVDLVRFELTTSSMPWPFLVVTGNPSAW